MNEFTPYDQHRHVLPARDPVEPLAVQRRPELGLRYLDELKTNLHALLNRRIPTLIDRKWQLTEKVAAEGKATRLLDEELATAKTLKTDGLFFLVGLTAVVTPKGRRLLAR